MVGNVARPLGQQYRYPTPEDGPMNQIFACVTWVTLVLTSLNGFASAQIAEGTPEQPKKLHTLVSSFNLIAAQDSVGKTQPALTTEEIVASITRWAQNPTIETNTKHSLLNIANSVAKNETIPLDTTLSFKNRFESFGIEFDVWWIELTSANYSIRIRDRTIASRIMAKKNNNDHSVLQRIESKSPRLTMDQVNELADRFAKQKIPKFDILNYPDRSAKFDPISNEWFIHYARNRYPGDHFSIMIDDGTKKKRFLGGM